jgi:isoleucyl-tRNA synthetase
MASLSQDQIAQLETEGSIKLDIEGEEAVVETSDVEIISEDIPGWLVSNEGNLTVALEIELTDELLNEGMARELINRIQNIRKESGLEITDRVAVTVASNEQTDKAIAEYADYIKTQVQADELNIGVNDGEAVDFDDFTLNIKVEKI